MSAGVVSTTQVTATKAGLDWAAVEALDDEQLERPLYGGAPAARSDLDAHTAASAGRDAGAAAPGVPARAPGPRGQRVASHTRSYERFRFTSDTSHMPEAHQRHFAGADAVIAWSTWVGPMTEAMVRRLLDANPVRDHGLAVGQGPAEARTQVGEARVEAACAHALHFGAQLQARRAGCSSSVASRWRWRAVRAMRRPRSRTRTCVVLATTTEEEPC